jgi:5'-nucleotidase (lipoprotein e(P4) family)
MSLAHTRTLPRRLIVSFACALAAACHSGTSAPIASPAPPPAVATPSGVVAATATLPEAIRWVQRSAEYHALIAQGYRAVTTRVEQQAASRKPGAWAVVLDADETIISNLRYQVERVGLGYSADSWGAWVRRREATPLPGAAGFLARVRELGGRIAIVTNRLESECADTIAVFKAHGLVFDAMLCRPDKGPSDKSPRFDAVAAGKVSGSTTPLEIVAFVGDNIQDFPGLTQALRQKGEAALAGFGVRYFLLPNPMYGSWETNR